MGMNVAGLRSGEEARELMDVNTTPLIDVMLVLLVMLILTIPTQLHAIKLDMGGAPSQREPVAHLVTIDFDGQVAWDGEALAGPVALEARMREVGAIAGADQPQVRIKPNKLVDYSAVAAVMATAQRNGVKNMGVVGNERFAS